MPLCPLYLTGVANGVYYYYCFMCPGNVPVGGQDTRSHLTGMNCSNILDQLQLLNTKTLLPVAAAVGSSIRIIEPVYLGDDAEASGLPEYENFDVPISRRFVNAAWNIRATEDANKTLATYRDPRGGNRRARLFTIEITACDPIEGPRQLYLQVGQELTPAGDIPAGPTHKPANHIATCSNFHHHIRLAAGGDTRDFHILLKMRD